MQGKGTDELQYVREIYKRLKLQYVKLKLQYVRKIYKRLKSQYVRLKLLLRRDWSVFPSRA